MNNLLFTALLIALLYYFFYYLPQQKKSNAQTLPLKHNQETQTETIIKSNTTDTLNCPGPTFISESETKLLAEKQELEKDIQQKERTIIGLNNSYTKLETKSKKELADLKNQIKTITHQLTELQTHQNTDEKAIESTLDQLLKGIQDLNTELN